MAWGIMGSIVCFVLAGCAPSPDPQTVLVQVGDVSIDVEDLTAYEARLPQHLESTHVGGAQIRDVIGGLVDRQIMIIEARKLGYFANVEVQRRLHGHTVEWLSRRLLVAVVGDTVAISADEEEQAYHSGWNRKVWLAHIELADEDSARHVAAQLATGAVFGELARIHSRAADAANDGDLGRYFSVADLPTALASAVKGLAVGDVSQVIDTGTGFEIIKVLDADSLGLEEVREPLRRSLQQRVIRGARAQFLADLEKQFRLVYDGAVIEHVQQTMSSDRSRQAFNPSSPLLTRGHDIVLLRAGDGVRLLRSGALGRYAFADSARFVTALRTRVLADTLLVWEAQERGLDRVAEFKSFHRRRHEKLAVTHLRKQEVLNRIVITEEEVQRRYQLDIREFSEPSTTEVTEIVVDTQQQAQQLLERIEQGADMADLSRQVSTREVPAHGHRHISEPPTPGQGNGLDEIHAAIQGRDVGALVGPLTLADGGFAIVRIEARFAASTRSLESVRPILEYKLKREKNRTEFEHYIHALRQKYSNKVIWHDQAIAEMAHQRR